MTGIKRWIENLSWRKRLILYGYLFLIPILLVICYILININYKKSVEEKQQSDLNTVEALANNIQIVQDTIGSLSTYICINSDIQTLLTSKNADKLNTDPRLWYTHAPMQIVDDIISLNDDINSIAIYPENDIKPYLRGMDGSVYYQDMDIVRAGGAYQKTQSAGMYWSFVPKSDKDTYQYNKKDKLVMYREIYDLTQKKNLGYIVIGAEVSDLKEACSKIIDRADQSVVVLDPTGGILCQSGEAPKWMLEHLTDVHFLKTSYLQRQSKYIYEGYSIVCSQKSENSSIVCKIEPITNNRGDTFEIIYMPLILMIGVLIGYFPLMIVVAGAVTRPLKKLSQTMEKIAEGDLSQRVELDTSDEIGEVGTCFNRMVDDIQKLIDENYVITLRERESELAALQAQINPHLLYNTLDSLYWQAEESGNDEIAENIYALSQLFRMILNKGESEVKVSQEIELVSRYLQIQKMRFPDKLEYDISLDENIADVMMPKLVLQPFVENAIVHGFENDEKPCAIKISAEQYGRQVRFYITDTGKGMTKEQIAEVWKDEPARYTKQRVGGYALKNIRERLRLRYHDDFVLDIMSAEGEGTSVVLMIPVA